MVGSARTTLLLSKIVPPTRALLRGMFEAKSAEMILGADPSFETGPRFEVHPQPLYRVVPETRRSKGVVQPAGFRWHHRGESFTVTLNV
jgi:hypothetical protein